MQAHLDFLVPRDSLAPLDRKVTVAFLAALDFPVLKVSPEGLDFPDRWERPESPDSLDLPVSCLVSSVDLATSNLL